MTEISVFRLNILYGCAIVKEYNVNAKYKHPWETNFRKNDVTNILYIEHYIVNAVETIQAFIWYNLVSLYYDWSYPGWMKGIFL